MADEVSVLLRMRDRMNVEFPIGCRVEMTEDGLRQFPSYLGREGKVVSHEKGVSPKVLWDGRRTACGYAPWFIRRL